jgi:hypothetical protein
MAKTLQFRRLSTAALANTVGANGELIVDSSNGTLSVHNGVTSGGKRLATETYVVNTANQLIAAAVPTRLGQLTNDFGYITTSASITGSAQTAIKLVTPRYINGVAFDGTANISIVGANANVVVFTTEALAQSAFSQANTASNTASSAQANTIILQGVNTTQNTRITSADNTANAAYAKANAAFDKANTGVSTSTDDYARTSSNTATNNITILQGVNTTQNTRITNAENTATAAYDKAYVNVSSNLTLNVTNSGTSTYLIAGASNPTLTLYRGVTYYFNINATGHPFYIQTVSGAYSAGNVYTSGVTAGGLAVGTITFTVPLDAPSNLYYVCQNHSAMNGAFLIENLISTVNTQNTRISVLEGGLISANARITGNVNILGRLLTTNGTIRISNTISYHAGYPEPGDTNLYPSGTDLYIFAGGAGAANTTNVYASLVTTPTVANGSYLSESGLFGGKLEISAGNSYDIAGDLNLKSGSVIPNASIPNRPGLGGSVNITAGDSYMGAGGGGTVTIQSGAYKAYATGGTGDAGKLKLFSGNAEEYGAGGDIEIVAGNGGSGSYTYTQYATNETNGGNIIITSGSGKSESGYIKIQSGSVLEDRGTAGPVLIYGADSLSANSFAGDVLIVGGKASNANSSSNISPGDVIISGGHNVTGNGFSGDVFITGGSSDNRFLALGGGQEGDTNTIAGNVSISGGYSYGNTSQAGYVSISSNNFVSISSNTKSWTFNNSGTLTFPDGSTQTTAANANAIIAAAQTVPQNAQSANYVLRLTDAGKHIYYTQSTNTILYIPTTANVAFSNGSTIMIVSRTSSSANVTVSPNTGVTMYLAGNTTSASRNVTTYGMATLIQVAANTWFINGTGVS